MYRYRELRAAHSIRLLRFLRDSGDEDIRCTIKEYDVVSDSIPYIALSYVWGDATIRHPIFLDGKIAHVTSNLREALAHLGNAFPHSSFWIDAICIDQQNPQERMHQVGQMRIIYSNATEVVMWLGPGHEDIERLNSMIESHHDQCRFLNDPVEGCGIVIDQGIVAAMQYLMQHPYWSRVWIIQEVVAAKNIRIMCGTTFLHWSHLTKFLLLISYRHFRFPYGVVFDQIQHHAHSFPMLRLRNWSQTSTDLAQALDWSASSLATDSRDKVYALLGLVNKGAGQLVSADYTCSSCNVYCFAIRAMAIDCDFDQRGFDFRSEVQRVKRSCLDKALQHEQASAVRRVRSIWWQSKKYLSTLLKHPYKNTNVLDTRCDGTKCGSKALMQRISRWHSWPELRSRRPGSMLSSAETLVGDASDAGLHEFFRRNSTKWLYEERSHTTLKGLMIARCMVLAGLSLSLHPIPANPTKFLSSRRPASIPYTHYLEDLAQQQLSHDRRL